jgi:hypothetical protein
MMKFKILSDKLNIFWVRSQKENEKTCPLHWVGRRSRSLIRRPSQKCSLFLLLKTFITFQTNRKSSSPYVPEAVTVFAGSRSPDERFGTVHPSHHLLIDDEVDNSHKSPDKLNIFWVCSWKENEKTCPLYWVGRRSRSLIRRPSQKCSLLFFLS